MDPLDLYPFAARAFDRGDRGGDRGEKARARLLEEAEKIFAEKGFAKASTREICAAAGLNAAAISYHFGGKDELYRAVLLGPIEAMTQQFQGFDEPGLSPAEALRRFMAPFVLGAGGKASGIRLHLRELVEPSPMYAQTVGQFIKPQHDALTRVLARHIGVEPHHEDAHRLVFALVAMAHDYCMSQEFMRILAPGLLDAADALPRALDRLVDWGAALVEHERRRHQSAGSAAAASAPSHSSP
jgi:TetR/AcrR family transcriptional regulator, regulator of cefoperazone and chloramphenicol sensitivity